MIYAIAAAMSDPPPTWILVATAGAAWVGALSGLGSLTWQLFLRRADRARSIRKRLVVNVRRHGPTVLYPPQIWRCHVTFEPEAAGEGFQLNAAIAEPEGSVADTRGPMTQLDERRRAIVVELVQLANGLPNADLWLCPSDGARTLAVRFTVRRTGGGKRVLAKTLHVSPALG
jgi:hypothetical protein